MSEKAELPEAIEGYSIKPTYLVTITANIKNEEVEIYYEECSSEVIARTIIKKFFEEKETLMKYKSDGAVFFDAVISISETTIKAFRHFV